MKVSLTWDFDKRMRMAVRARTGETGLATWAECRNFMDGLLSADCDCIWEEFDKQQAKVTP